MLRHRTFLLIAAFAMLALLPGATLAAGGTDHFGPFASSSTDHGTCSYNAWATDSFDRYFTVHDNGDGTFSVSEQLKDGTFVTLGSSSPGGCESGPNHGSTVVAGIQGNFNGAIGGTVTSATYDPNGCDAAGADCSTTDGFLTAVFGASGPSTFTCNFGYAGCRFNFEYNSSDKSLSYHHWQDKSDNHGGEQFIGDIAN
jgi:hypothetical protein